MCALPRTKPLRFRFLGISQWYRLSWACVLCPSQIQAAWATKWLENALFPAGWCILSPPPSQPLGFLGFLTDVNRPGSQEDLVSNGEPAHSLVEDVISGAEIAPCLLPLAVACLPLCLWQGNGPICSWLALLWYSLNPLFCEQTRVCLRLELCAGTFSLSFFFSL